MCKELQKFHDMLEKDSEMYLVDVELDSSSVIERGTFLVKTATLHKTEYVVAKSLRSCHQHHRPPVGRYLTECKYVLQILRTTFHPNILRMYGFTNNPITEMFPYLITEFMPRTVTRFIQENKFYKQHYYNPELKLHIARDIANGLCSKFLHSHMPSSLIHCSLTCDNILLTEYCQAKISNFSRVRTENEDLPKTCQELKSYLPPEALSGNNSKASKNGDMYAFGKIVYYITTDTIPSLHVPEEGYNEDLIVTAATKDDHHHCLHTVAVKEILSQINPNKRMPAEEAFRFLHKEIGQVVQPKLDIFNQHGSVRTSLTSMVMFTVLSYIAKCA